VLLEGSYNVTRKMQWDMHSAHVDLNDVLNVSSRCHLPPICSLNQANIFKFVPNVTYWLHEANTFRVVFIRSQASWLVVTGSDFVIDADGTGGIQRNGQTWWDYFRAHQKNDDDG